jgi:hypothetical protein
VEWTGRQARFGVRKSPYLGHICHWNSHTRDSPRCLEEACTGFLPRFARLRSRWAVEHGQKNTSTCSTRPERARARPAPDLARLAPRQAMPVSPARARAYKASQVFSRTPPRALDLTGARDHRRLPSTRRASGRPIPRHRRPASRAIPSPIQPSGWTLRASVKLSERGIELCLTGDARSRSPDFTRPPANIDRAPRWIFLPFLARVDSLTPREASCALGLTHIAIVRPEHMPPTSSPACARVPADSGHHRRRVVPRCDRNDLPKPTPPFAGPPSPLVSRTALFPFVGTVQRGGRDLGEEGIEVRGIFELSETLMNSCAGV